nr:hypothetical protein GCM10020093_063030 [Planobispora longispora]
MSVPRPAAVIVLAAGEGTRMKSKTPKILHELCGRTLVDHMLTAARGLEPERLIVVIGHGRERVGAHLALTSPDAQTVVQAEQRGTGHAVRTVLEEVGAVEGTVLVTYGDTPLLRTSTLAGLLERHAGEGNAVTVLTAEVPDPHGYGRIVRDGTGAVLEIVEEKDATAEQRAIREMNSGVYAFDGALLADAVKRVSTANVQGRSTSPTSCRSCAGTVTGSARTSRPTTSRSRASTTGSSWRSRARCSTPGCWRRTCGRA